MVPEAARSEIVIFFSDLTVLTLWGWSRLDRQKTLKISTNMFFWYKKLNKSPCFLILIGFRDVVQARSDPI